VIIQGLESYQIYIGVEYLSENEGRYLNIWSTYSKSSC